MIKKLKDFVKFVFKRIVDQMIEKRLRVEEFKRPSKEVLADFIGY